MPLAGVLLDIDGTLLMSNRAHAEAWSDAYREFGYDIPAGRVEPLIGMGGDKLMARLTPDLKSGEGIGKELTQRRQQIFMRGYLPHLQPAPGGRALVQRLGELDLKLTVATSAKDQELDGLLKQAKIDDLIERTTTSDDAQESKPDPDIVAAALQKSKLSADQVVMLGDTPYDIESAGKIGVAVIAVRCGGHPDSDLKGAIAIYDDPADILRHFDESPIGQRLGLGARR